MSTFLKPVVLGLGLVAGIAIGAHAQTVSGAPTPGPSVASLPLEGPRANSSNSIPSPVHQAVVPSGSYPGVAPGGGWYPADEHQTQAVTKSQDYPGPRPN
jgi:hypothetical protein